MGRAGRKGSLALSQYPERDFYIFTYHNGWAVNFAQVEVWAQLAGGTGTTILVFGGHGSLLTDGNGLLARIPNNKAWISPEVRLFDRSAGRAAKFPLFAWSYQVDWDRPAPFAEFDNQTFDDVYDFLTYLSTRYGFLSICSRVR